MMMFWREIVIAALFAALALAGNAYLGKRDELAEVRAEFDSALEKAREARVTAKAASDRAIEILRIEHNQRLKEVENNAWVNFKRRYPNFAGCVPPQPAVPGPAGANSSDSPQSLDAAGQEFVAACANDASTLAEWQRWVRLNKLPVEGE